MDDDDPVSQPHEVLTPYAEALKLLEANPFEVAEVDMGAAFGLSDRNSLKFIILPPGTRLHPPLAHLTQDTLITSLSGSGLIWQNGWTYPFDPMDSAGWKAGTGVAYTIINEGSGVGDDEEQENLILLVAQELKPGSDKIHLRLPSDVDNTLPEDRLWFNPPRQNELGPHPALPAVAFDEKINDVPPVTLGPRPSNIVHGPSMTDTIREGELECEGTSLSQETALSGRIGINLEILPPGRRSSYPHAHKVEDELIYVLGGHGLVWVNGQVTPVTTGDVLAFPAGTGVAHTFINDANADDPESGEELALWIFGENRVKEGERWFYPMNSELEVRLTATIHGNGWWDDCPKQELGPHSGRPSRPSTTSFIYEDFATTGFA